MREKTRAAVLLALLIAIVVMPLGSRAELPRSGTLAQCYGYTAANGAGSCTATFALAQSGFVSNLETHAHFHHFFPDFGPTRFVTLEWWDSAGELVYSTFCQDRGGSLADQVGQEIGPSDLTNATCASVYHKTRYFAGEQTLAVTGDMVPHGAGFKFHGKLFITTDGGLF